MSIIDCEFRHSSDITLEELDEDFDYIAVISVFSLPSLKGRIKEKYSQSIYVDDLLSKIFRSLNNSEPK